MKIIAFGSSFVNIFYPLKNNNFKIVRYRGATIKGLVNKNDNYNDIISKLSSRKYDYGLFIFGDPDVLFYYLKKKYIDNVDENIVKETIFDSIIKYVKLVKKLKNIKYKVICNITVPTLDSNVIAESIEKYYKYDISNMDEHDKMYSNRYDLVIKCNSILKNECKKYNIIFCDNTKYITKNNRIDDFFKLKHNEYNIHTQFEYILIVYLKTCLSFLCDENIYDSYDNILKKIKSCYNIYLQQIKMKNPEIDITNSEYTFNPDYIYNLVTKN